MSFVLDWKKKLGYKKDPFTERPSKKAAEFLVAREKEREKLNLFVIKQERFGMLKGAKQSGKSLLLHWLQEELQQHMLKVKVLLIDDPKILGKEKPFFKHLLEDSMSLLEKRVTKPHEKMQSTEHEHFLFQKIGKRRLLIIIDNGNELSSENQAFLRRLLAACPGAQLLLSLERVLKEHEQFGLDGLKVSVKELKEESLKELLIKRVALAGGVDGYPFTAKEFTRILNKAKGNPAKLLEVARERAIELSLRVTGPPPKPKPQKREQKEPEVPKKKKQNKWFKIKFVKKDEQPLTVPTPDEEVIQEEILTPSSQASQDDELLSSIVSEAESEDAPPEAETPTEEVAVQVDEVIETLIEEIEQPKKRKKR